MITNFELINFKSHKQTKLEVSNLTVFCGANGVGKSSAIQALLLLRESFLNNSNFEYLDLKSNPVTVGTVQDALYQFSDSNEIRFNLSITQGDLCFSFSAKDSELTKTLIKASNPISLSKYDLFKEGLFNKTCQFVGAGRLGPQSSYMKDDVVVEVYNQISVIEGKAEHFVNYLYYHKDEDVLDELIHPLLTSKSLLSQVTAWEREISHGVNVVVQDLGNLGYELKYDFNTDSGRGKTNEFKASNVGFGLTYVMPIIVAILSSKPGALILIENPESHLHPNGQSKLAELICLAAQAGIQIILETHSDHIVNGILVQSKRFEEDGIGINKDNVAIYHIGQNQADHCSIALKIPIEEGGRIRYAPKGFFDQFTIDRKRLLGF